MVARPLRRVLARWLARLADAVRPPADPVDPHAEPVRVGTPVGAGNEHWLAMVRSRAPELLEGGGIRAGGDVAARTGGRSTASIPRFDASGGRAGDGVPNFGEQAAAVNAVAPTWPRRRERQARAPRWPSARTVIRSALAWPWRVAARSRRVEFGERPAAGAPPPALDAHDTAPARSAPAFAADLPRPSRPTPEYGRAHADAAQGPGPAFPPGRQHPQPPGLEPPSSAPATVVVSANDGSNAHYHSRPRWPHAQQEREQGPPELAVAQHGRWPELPDDSALWVPPRSAFDAAEVRRLDDEQRGR